MSCPLPSSEPRLTRRKKATPLAIYSLVETCRKLGVNPYEYLKELFNVLPTMQQSDATDWTPARWKSSHEQTTQPSPMG